MFDFHCSDRGLNPGLGCKISWCLQLHYRAAPLASVWKPYAMGSPKPWEGNWVVRWVPEETQDCAIVAHKLALSYSMTALSMWYLPLPLHLPSTPHLQLIKQKQKQAKNPPPPPPPPHTQGLRSLQPTTLKYLHVWMWVEMCVQRCVCMCVHVCMCMCACACLHAYMYMCNFVHVNKILI